MYVYFSLGTNLGDKEHNLRLAVRKIEERVGKVISLSAFYTTAPWGFSSEHFTQEIEREMGRTHKSVGRVYSDRVIDIDLLLCFAARGELVRVDAVELKLPHPLMWERDFVMRPLKEIYPDGLQSVLPALVDLEEVLKISINY